MSSPSGKSRNRFTVKKYEGNRNDTKTFVDAVKAQLMLIPNCGKRAVSFLENNFPLDKNGLPTYPKSFQILAEPEFLQHVEREPGQPEPTLLDIKKNINSIKAIKYVNSVNTLMFAGIAQTIVDRIEEALKEKMIDLDNDGYRIFKFIESTYGEVDFNKSNY